MFVKYCKTFNFKAEEDEEEEEEEESEDDDDDDEDGMLKWKENLKIKASALFERNRKVNWSRLVYEDESNAGLQSVPTKLNDDDGDTFFRVKKARGAESDPISFDNTKYLSSFHTWTNDQEVEETAEAFDSIRDCFVTGKWDKKSDAKHLLDGDNDDDSDVWDAFDEPFEPGSGDEEMYGDFEDMETGEVHKAADKKGETDEDEDDEEDESEDDKDGKRKKNGDGGGQIRKKPKSEMSKRERLLEKKKRLKEQFDRG